MDKNKDKNFVSVYITASQSELAFIKSLLDANKIIYYIDNENAATIGDSVPYVDIMVSKEGVILAKELLKNFTG